MTTPITDTEILRQRILDRIDDIIQECESRSRPLEVEPWKGQLFELFVTADGAGCLSEESDCNLSADAICQSLAHRWGLKSAAESWVQQNGQLPPAQLSRMRSLWSVLRMWMEWTYAWRRWEEFHTGNSPSATPSSGEP